MKLPWDAVPEDVRSEWRDNPITKRYLESLMVFSQNTAEEVNTMVFDGVAGAGLSVKAGTARGLSMAADLAKAKGPDESTSK